MPQRLLSPSGFKFLYSNCPRCTWIKLQPLVLPNLDGPMPAVTRKADEEMKATLGLADVQTYWPDAVSILPLSKVVSKPVPIAGQEYKILGYLDLAVGIDDGTVGIVDYKLTEPKSERASDYARQMNAYAFALAHPERGAALTVSRAALRCFYPEQFRADPSGRAAFVGHLSTIPVEINPSRMDAEWLRLKEILSQPGPPPPNPRCTNCTAMRTIFDYLVQSHE